MLKNRIFINDVFVKRNDINLDERTKVVIATNGIDDENHEAYHDDGKRLRISLYSEDMFMSGNWKHGFSIDASSSKHIRKLIDNLKELIRKTEELIYEDNEPVHWDKSSQRYDKNQHKYFVFDDIHSCDSVEELNGLKTKIGGWIKDEEVSKEFNSRLEKLSA